MRHYLKHDMNNKYIFYFWLKNCTLLELFHAAFSMAWHRVVWCSVPWFRVLSHHDYIYCIAANAITCRTCSWCLCVCVWHTSMYVDGNGDNQLNKDVNNNLMKNNFSEFSNVLCLSRDFLQYRQICVDFGLVWIGLLWFMFLFGIRPTLHLTWNRATATKWNIDVNYILKYSMVSTFLLTSLTHPLNFSLFFLLFVRHNRSRWSKRLGINKQ